MILLCIALGLSIIGLIIGVISIVGVVILYKSL